jgi:hypothetical protein
VKSFWVRPADRRLGIARLFAEYARSLGLPGYLGFANKHAVAAAFDAKSSYAAGSIEGWVFDAEAMLAYATVRRFLRTLQWREFTNLDTTLAPKQPRPRVRGRGLKPMETAGIEPASAIA